MKKNIFHISALVLILGLSFTNCHSKSDNSLYQTNALLFNYINDIASGNCAQTTKYTNSAGVSTYVAQGYAIPKAGCNSSTLGSTYTSVDATSIAAKTDAYFDKITNYLDTLSACSTMSSAFKGNNTNLNNALTQAGGTIGTIKTLTTAATIAAAAAGNSAGDVETKATGPSTSLGPKNCRLVKIGLLYTAGVHCTTAADATAAQEKVKYSVVNSVTGDMNVNFEANKDILAAAKTGEVNYFSKAAVNSTRMMTTAEIANLRSDSVIFKADAYALVGGLYQTLTGQGGQAAGLAATLNAPNCLAAIGNAESALKDILIRIPFAYYLTTINANVTFADRQAVTTPFLPYLYCRYGTNVTATTTSLTATASTPAEGLCPTSYPSF